MSEAMLEFHHVKTGYGSHIVLEDVSITIKRGEFAALIGSNGTGKSTLLKCASGLLPIREGRVEICGSDQKKMKPKERARLVAVVPQAFQNDYDFLVEDIVMMGRNPYMGFGRKESSEDFEIVEKAMEMTNTLAFRNRKYNQLSGGEKQRVILARAIAQQPQIILLDEPTSALDVHHQTEVMELITKLNVENQMTILAVLHDINLAARYCDRIIMLQNGRVEDDGVPQRVISKKNMEKLYSMRLLIRENPIFQKPEMVPLRVLNQEQPTLPFHIHIICGGGNAGKLLEELDYRGHQITAGVINLDCDDWQVCHSLNLSCVTAEPFTAVTPLLQAENLCLMAHADIIIVSDIPFGPANIHNLDGLEALKGQLYICSSSLENDFTNGALGKRLNEIEKHKSIYYYHNYEELISMICAIREDSPA